MYAHMHTCIHTYAHTVAASSGLDGYIKLWDLESGKLVKSIDGGPGTEQRISAKDDSSIAKKACFRS